MRAFSPIEAPTSMLQSTPLGTCDPKADALEFLQGLEKAILKAAFWDGANIYVMILRD